LKPALAYRQLPLITMPPKQCTYIEPMKTLLQKARAIEEEASVVNVTLAMGFPFADIRDAGVAVMVTTDNDEALAQQKAEEMAKAIWDRRDDFNVKLTPVSEAIAYSRNHPKELVVLADGSDNPGGGGPCDGTVILRQLIEENVEGAVVAVIADPEAVSLAMNAGVGGKLTLDLGGKTDDRHGEPLRVTAYVRLISDGSFIQTGPMATGVRADMGKTAVLVANGVEVVVTEQRIQPYDAALLRSVGIEPTERRIIALKSAVHFRSAYQEIADRIFDMDTPGVHRPDFGNYAYRRLRSPIHPLAPNVAFDSAPNHPKDSQ
jgi:microcystin degradation protein MlrC